METLQTKTTGPVSVQMAVSSLVGQMKTEERTCVQHGPYVSSFWSLGGGFWTDCPACEKQRRDQEQIEAVRQAEHNRAQARMQNALQRAAIPPRFADRRFENFERHCDGAVHALTSMQEYAGNFAETLKAGRCMLLVGTVGAGKTHLAAATAHSVIAQGYSSVFASVMSAVRSVKETYRRDSDRTERDAIDALIAPDLLILDEVGVQFGSDAEKLILFEIINGRYESVKPTILLSNLNMNGLKEYMGERTVDRLREGGGKQITFDWPSYRANAIRGE